MIFVGGSAASFIRSTRAHSWTVTATEDYAALPASDDLMAYIRKSADRRFLVALNFAGQSRSFNLDELQARGAVLRLSTYLDREDERLENELVLRADEGVIVELV